MTEAMRASARQLALVVSGGFAASVALGVALGISQGESVVRWVAYMLYLAGALVLGFAFLSCAPPSPRKLARQRLQRKDEPEEPAPKPFASELVVLAVAAAALFAGGVLVELAA